MTYQALINLDENRVGEVYSVQPVGFVWGDRELASYGRWIVVDVDASEDAGTVGPLLTVWDETPDLDDPELTTMQPRWRLRLSELDAGVVHAGWAVGMLELSAADFEHNCESLQRNRFDPDAVDGQGEAWPDADQAWQVEPMLQDPF